MNTIRTYLKKLNDKESKIPFKLPNAIPTRPWCGLANFFLAFTKSYDSIKEVIPSSIDMPSDKKLIEIVSCSLNDFSPIFESFEAASKPTLHLVIKNYKEIHKLMNKWERQVESFKVHLKKSIFFIF